MTVYFDHKVPQSASGIETILLEEEHHPSAAEFELFPGYVDPVSNELLLRLLFPIPVGASIHRSAEKSTQHIFPIVFPIVKKM